MKIKKLCTVVLLLFLSFYAKAQIWQAYKGVWLKGYDNATQAPIPPTGYSALTYFADSLGTYVYDWDSLAWLRVPGAGGGGSGGGGFTTADNGLTASSPTNVQLGGPLIKNTTIPLGGFSYTVGQFPDNVNFSVNDASNTITANLSAGSSGALFSMTPSNAVFQHSGASGTATLTLNQSTETGTISSSSGSQINFNVATPASPVITTQAAENFTISKPLGLMSSSGSLQIGGPDGLVTSLENTESGNTAIFDVRGTNRTFSMRSGSGGSRINFDVANTQLGIITFTPDNLNSTNGFRINNASTNSNASIDFRFGGTPEIGIFKGAGTNQMIIRNNGITSGAGSNFTIGTSNDASVILLKGGTSGTIILERTSGANGTVNIFGGSGQSGTSEAGESILIRAGQGGSSGGTGGDMTIRGGAGGSSGSSGGDTYVISGQGNGGGPDGNVIIDALTGFLILSNLPTTDPCGSAPTGTVWSDSGTLKICP